MKILLLSQWCAPEPDLKVLPLARELKLLGHEVEILTGFPNYPGGVVYDNYKIKFYDKEIREGVVIHRAPLFPSHDKKKLHRIWNYLSFFLGSILIGLLKVKKVDVIYAYHPPMTTVFSGIVLKIFKRTKLLIDIQDMWPDTLATTGMINNQKILKIIGEMCLIAYRLTDKIVVLSNGFKSVLIERGIPEAKIDVINNWALETKESSFLKNEIRSELNFDNFTIVFAGNIGPAQALEVIIETAEKIKDLDVTFCLLGSGLSLEKLKKMANEKSLRNIRFEGRVSPERAKEYLLGADALLVHLKRDRLFEVTIPSKIQSYMNVGRPILIGVDGDARDIIEKSKSGFFFEPENSDSLCDVVFKMYNLKEEEREIMAKASYEYYQKNLSIKVGVKKFEKVFLSLNS